MSARGAKHYHNSDQRRQPGSAQHCSRLLPALRQPIPLVDPRGRKQDQQRTGGGHVEDDGESRGDRGGARQRVLRIADFAAHHADEFHARHGIGDGGPETHGLPVPLGK